MVGTILEGEIKKKDRNNKSCRRRMIRKTCSKKKQLKKKGNHIQINTKEKKRNK